MEKLKSCKLLIHELSTYGCCVSEGTTNHAELAVVQAVVQKVEEVVCKSIEDMTEVADSVEILRRTQPKKRRRLEPEVDMTT